MASDPIKCLALDVPPAHWQVKKFGLSLAVVVATVEHPVSIRSIWWSRSVITISSLNL